jgi:hypothetical protein
LRRLSAPPTARHQADGPLASQAASGQLFGAVTGALISSSAAAAPVTAWLVTDEHAELIAGLGRLAAARGLVPHVGSYAEAGLDVTPHPVVHTSHSTVGNLIAAAGRSVAWAPEFLEFPGGRRTAA